MKMKKWNEMNKEQKTNIVYYSKYLNIETLTNVQKKTLKRIHRFCLKHDLCVTEIPVETLFDDIYKTMAVEMHPDKFNILYDDYYFIDEMGASVDVKSFISEHNKTILEYDESGCEVFNDNERYYKLFLRIKYCNKVTPNNLLTLETYQAMLHKSFSIEEKIRPREIEWGTIGKVLTNDQRIIDFNILKSPDIISAYRGHAVRNNLFRSDDSLLKTQKDKLDYLAKSIDKPSHFGGLILSELKAGDRSMPALVNRAVNIGLLDSSYYIE